MYYTFMLEYKKSYPRMEGDYIQMLTMLLASLTREENSNRPRNCRQHNLLSTLSLCVADCLFAKGVCLGQRHYTARG